MIKSKRYIHWQDKVGDNTSIADLEMDLEMQEAYRYAHSFSMPLYDLGIEKLLERSKIVCSSGRKQGKSYAEQKLTEYLEQVNKLNPQLKDMEFSIPKIIENHEERLRPWCGKMLQLANACEVKQPDLNTKIVNVGDFYHD